MKRFIDENISVLIKQYWRQMVQRKHWCLQLMASIEKKEKRSFVEPFKLSFYCILQFYE